MYRLLTLQDVTDVTDVTVIFLKTCLTMATDEVTCVLPEGDV